MGTRSAACACGQITLSVIGEPSTVSMCHCLQCQRRTGSTYSVHAYFSTEQVTIRGAAKRYSRPSDAGRLVHFHFCTNCGSTTYWYLEPFPDRIGVPVGLFADPAFPPPKVSIFAPHRHPWVAVPPGIPQTDGHSPKFNEEADRAVAELRRLQG